MRRYGKVCRQGILTCRTGIEPMYMQVTKHQQRRRWLPDPQGIMFQEENLPQAKVDQGFEVPRSAHSATALHIRSVRQWIALPNPMRTHRARHPSTSSKAFLSCDSDYWETKAFTTQTRLDFPRPTKSWLTAIPTNAVRPGLVLP